MDTALVAGHQSTRFYIKSADLEDKITRGLLASDKQARNHAVPQIYSPDLGLWASFEDTESNHGTLRTGTIHTLPETDINTMSPDGILKIVSWNLGFNMPDPGSRATAAISHLESLCGSTPDDLIVLQEVC